MNTDPSCFSGEVAVNSLACCTMELERAMPNAIAPNPLQGQKCHRSISDQRHPIPGLCRFAFISLLGMLSLI
jgi:hypothetical protein